MIKGDVAYLFGDDEYWCRQTVEVVVESNVEDVEGVYGEEVALKRNCRFKFCVSGVSGE